MNRLSIVAVLALLAGAAIPETAAAQCVNDLVTRVQGKSECFVIHTARIPDGEAVTNLAIFIHGDQSDGGPVTAMVSMGLDIRVPPGTAKVALLRPGYPDREGNASTGNNYGRNDSYTADVNDAVAAAIRALKEKYKPHKTVIIGHSGGAAITAVMIGRHPGIADGALLLACPCNIDRWRSGKTAWSRSLSPHRYTDGVPTATRVTAITGSGDTNTWGGLAEGYVAALKQRGVNAEYQTVPNATHGSILSYSFVSPPLAQLLQ